MATLIGNPQNILIGQPGNLLLIGSAVSLVVAEGARRQGGRLGFAGVARRGVPAVLVSMLLAGLWLNWLFAW